MFLDFRSDTVTKPTEEMRKAMYHAEVGDDVYGDDPTVARLETLAAEILGKEAALFVPSGTFGNQLCILTHTKRGDEILVGEDAHIMWHEVGGAAVIAGVQTRTIPTDRGRMDPKAIELAIRPKDIHYPDTGLLCLENAHGTGSVLSIEEMEAMAQVAKKHGIPVHLDGARLFNASVALGVSPAELARSCDSVNVCLSKGLGAPVGSVIAGDKAFIEIARKNRKLMGGGMRQAGVIAAAGIVALEKMIQRLADDHAGAQYLAEGLSQLQGVTIKWDCLDINMVFFTLETAKSEEEIVDALLERDIKVNGTELGEWRFVTNLNTSLEDIDRLLIAMKEILE